MSATTLLHGGEAPVSPPGLTQLSRYLGQHSSSFAFAATLIPEPHRTRLTRVYAYCRFADDLADRLGGAQALERVNEWMSESRAAYDGKRVDNALIRETMRDMAASGVPFRYAEQLGEGMRMDLRGERYETMEELRVYCHRVAGTVGLWLTELFGVRDPRTLECAALLGFAMQITNIVRDVGEDWRRGRLYIPAEIMARHELTGAMIEDAMAGSGRVPLPYKEVMKDLIRVADAAYGCAWPGIAGLPGFFQPAVAVAARVYASIHGAVRENQYDSLRTRAVTSTTRKLIVARVALRDLGAPAELIDAAVAGQLSPAD